MPESAADAPLLTGRFQRAFALASEIHGGQVRKGTAIPYIAHLMSVAALVLEYGGGEDAAIGGLLHDAVEDSDDGAATEALIRSEFGDHVADIVMGCSNAVGVSGQAKAPWRERKAAYIERLARESDPDVLLVSACDKLHNARSILADLSAVGAATWERFSESDPAEQLWYYETLTRGYGERVPGAVSESLNEIVAAIELRTRSASDY